MHFSQQVLRQLDFLHQEGYTPLFYRGAPFQAYCCPTCQTHWMVDPVQAGVSTASATAATFQAQLERQHFIERVCRPCAARHPGGVLEIDAFGEGKGGYGINWEAPLPSGTHLMACVYSQRWLESLGERALEVEPLTRPRVLQAVLCWLADLSSFPFVHLLETADARRMARSNPPGHGVEGMQWYGGFFEQVCPPLQDRVFVSVSMALPAETTRRSPELLLEIVPACQRLAKLATKVSFPDESTL